MPRRRKDAKLYEQGIISVFALRNLAT